MPWDPQTSEDGCRFSRSPSVVFRRIGDELLLVPMHRKASDVSSIFTLNEVAGRIWGLLDGGRTLGDLRDALVEEFEVDAAQAEADLVEFLGQLEAVGAIIRD